MEWSAVRYILENQLDWNKKKILWALDKKRLTKSFLKEQKSGWYQVPKQHRKTAKKFLKTQGKEM